MLTLSFIQFIALVDDLSITRMVPVRTLPILGRLRSALT